MIAAHHCPRCGRQNMVDADGTVRAHTIRTVALKAHPSGWRPCVPVVMPKLGGVVRLVRTLGPNGERGPYRGGPDGSAGGAA